MIIFTKLNQTIGLPLTLVSVLVILIAGITESIASTITPLPLPLYGTATAYTANYNNYGGQFNPVSDTGYIGVSAISNFYGDSYNDCASIWC